MYVLQKVDSNTFSVFWVSKSWNKDSSYVFGLLLSEIREDLLCQKWLEIFMVNLKIL